MPGKNLSRVSIADSYYHVYNRGINGRKIFLDEQDYKYFTALFDRHLGTQISSDRYGRQYVWLADKLEVQVYCWMPTHFHLLIYQLHEHGISSLMQSICTAYTMYFNRKYGRRGPLFESNYRASLVGNDSYLMHISRYIHLNPKEYKSWPYSSYQEFVSLQEDTLHKGLATHYWLKAEQILQLFDSKAQYAEFVADYEDNLRALDDIKHQLADDI